MQKMIPFNLPYVPKSFINDISHFCNNKQFSGDGFYSKECQIFLEKHHPGMKCLLVSSGSHALELALMSAEIPQGSEVILPSFNFTSAANAIMREGLVPVFSDVQIEDCNMDFEDFLSLVTNKTRGVVLLHYGGRPSLDLERIIKFCEQNNILVIEDNAHGLFGEFNKLKLGTFGDISIASFHETKNFHSGEGGAIFFKSEKLFRNAEIIREKGTDRSSFFRGEIDKYTWKRKGSSFLMSELQAFLLHSQFQELDSIIFKRKEIFLKYEQLLFPLFENQNIFYSKYLVGSANHIFWIQLPSSSLRRDFISHMKENKIMTPFHYQDLASNYSQFTKITNEPRFNSILLSDTLIRLPIFFDLDEDSQLRIIDNIYKFF